MTELEKLKSAVKLIHDFCNKQIRCEGCPFTFTKNWRNECLLEEFPYDWDEKKIGKNETDIVLRFHHKD